MFMLLLDKYCNVVGGALDKEGVTSNWTVSRHRDVGINSPNFS